MTAHNPLSGAHNSRASAPNPPHYLCPGRCVFLQMYREICLHKTPSPKPLGSFLWIFMRRGDLTLFLSRAYYEYSNDGRWRCSWIYMRGRGRFVAQWKPGVWNGFESLDSSTKPSGAFWWLNITWAQAFVQMPQVARVPKRLKGSAGAHVVSL